MKKTNAQDVLSGDSYQTPLGILQLICETLGLGDFEMKLFDCCWFNPIFNRNVDSNFYSRRFPENTVLYCNPPFSQWEAFFLRCFILFAYFDMNIVVLMPQERFKTSEFILKYVEPLLEIVPL
jgi:hypothetical protein